MQPEHWLYTIPLRLQSLFRRGQVDQELDDELRDHVERGTEEFVAKGLAPREARRQALLKMGGIERRKEECREARRVNWIQDVIQDLRYGLRMLRKSPGFAAIAILTLALGVGTNTAIFSVVDAVLLRPLHFQNPASLTMVWEDNPSYGLLHNTVAPPNLLDWEQQNHCLSAMAPFLDQPINLTGAGQPEQVDVEHVSPNFFSLLGVNPMLGRGFSQGEDQPGKSNVVVLSYGLWKSKFGGDPNVIGKTVQLSGEANTVIGVTAPDFDFYISEFSFTHEPPQLWAPLEIKPAWHDWSEVGRFLRVIARVKPGLSIAQAQAQMNVITADLAARYPTYDKGWGVALVSLRDQLSGTLRPALFILLGAVGFVLLIACANISSLLLSRAAGRRLEMAIRAALGASPSRITRQLLTESLLLGIMGGTLGAIVAIWTTKALVHAGSASLVDVSAVTVDWRILAFAAGVTLLAALLAGLLPSFMAARGGVASALPEGGRTSSEGRKSLAARSAFVVVEISLALVLLAGSSLLIKSFFRLTEVNPGFHIAHLLTFQITLPDSKYRQDRVRAAFFSQFLGKIRALPGTISTTADVAPPFSGIGAATDVAIVGEPPRPPGQSLGTDVRVIEPDYFSTMDIPLLRGRTFNDHEFAQQSNVVIINKTFADKYFGGRNPLGQRIIIDMKDKNLPDEIIGIVGDVHESSLASAPDPVSYWPYPELPYSVMTVVVRTATPPPSMVPAIRQTLQQIDRDQPMAKIATMDQLVSDSVASSRFTMVLLSAFAGVALVLACVGIYGVMAYSVAQRTHEIGIRLALGAQRRDVLRLVLGQSARLALIGVGIGLAAALMLTRLMTTLLYHVSASDPWTFAAVAILLTFIALLACYIPARRAMSVDPMVALRYE
jgi:putative ABC transport system permease protein